MRRPMMVLAMAALTAPLAAQDTSITIQRNNTASECRVVINGRTLSESEAKPICQRAEGSTMLLRFKADTLRMNAEGLRSRMLELEIDSMAPFSSRLLVDRLAGTAKRLEELQSRDADRRGQLFNFFPTLAARPIIGVSVDPTPRDSDRHGAYVQAVTPNGPADKAGLRSGDIITKLAGKEIGSSERVTDPSAQSIPSIKLIEVAGSLEVGKAVRIEFRRDSKNLNAQITPVEDRTALVFDTPVLASELRNRAWVPVPRPPNTPSVVGRPGAIWQATPSVSSFSFEFGGPLTQLELAPVNEELGSYFGVKEGVLVVNAPADSELKLRAGDIVSAVDGRRIETPNEFLRVLRSYDRDRTFMIQITRQKRQETITAKLP
ncbi:MAG: PDZ domain-containing protein [Gemmatimonadales bacterium]|nr:PDZ domain-containing protein [Gemmatimonadales bacterium]MDZ4390203.1 PDZ domain-containing protein [Gemmatimonadales bacterium]